MDRSKIGQFFREKFKKNDSNTPVKSGEIITFMFARFDEKERAKLMNFIDDFIIEEFKIKESNLPWLSTHNRDSDEDWSNFFVFDKVFWDSIPMPRELDFEFLRVPGISRVKTTSTKYSRLQTVRI
jgi:hypothetical protein